MTVFPAPDHKRASLELYLVVALNTTSKTKASTISKTTAARILVDLLQVDLSTPLSWLRGDFKKRPLTRENFLRFVRTYRGGQGLESPAEIRKLALYLYGADFQRAIDLLDPQDREEEPAETAQANLELYRLLESHAEAVELALGAMDVHHWTEADLMEKLAAIPADIGGSLVRLMRLSLSQFSEGVNEAFARLGGLPQLSLYNLDSLGALWEKDGKELAELVSLFEGLHILKMAGENEWRISADILDFARQQLGELPAKTQRHAGNWWRRLLEQPKHLGGFRAYLASRGAALSQKPKPARFRFWLAEDWKAMQAFLHHLDSSQFLLAQFLLGHCKRNMALGWLLSIWLGLAPLLSDAPLWTFTAIGSGVLALFRLMVNVQRCHAAWDSLWEDIIRKTKPPGLDSPVYTCQHGHPQRRGGAHHLLQP